MTSFDFVADEVGEVGFGQFVLDASDTAGFLVRWGGDGVRPDQRPERIAEAWPPAMLARLRELKKRYDPANVFRDNFNIDPLAD